MKPKFSIPFLVSILLSILLGAVFLLSALTKLYPVEPFEYTFVDLGIGNWQTAPFIARILIGLEFVCGGLLILNLNLRRFTLPLVAGLLLVFCAYLTGVIIVKGNSGNCGCFGEYLSMTPLQAIIKNVGLLTMCILIYLMTTPFRFPFPRIVGGVLFITGLVLPFILNYVDLENSSNIRPESVNYHVPLDFLYHSKNPDNIAPTIDLLHGKYVIAYLSLTCPHCKVAAQKIHVLHKTDPTLPFYLILNGKKPLYEPYIQTYGLSDIPHQLFLGPDEFVKMAGAALPQILWVNNSVVEKKGGYNQLTEKGIKDWLAQPDTTQTAP